MLSTNLADAGVRVGEHGPKGFVDSPKLKNQQQVRNWVQDELSEQLGFSGANELFTDSQSQSLNGDQVLRISQRYKNLPVVGHESRLVVDGEIKTAKSFAGCSPKY